MEMREVTLTNESGLHARPAQKFVQAAGKFVCDVRIIKSNGIEVDAKSILGVMSLGLDQGSTFTIKAEGEDSKEAVQELADMVASGFGES